MKTIKGSMIALAFVLGIGGAFATNAPKMNKPANVWWSFTGTQDQINDPSKYTYSSTDPGCSGTTDRCAVEAPRSTSNPNQPNLALIAQEELKN
jgi:hypothetical protein